MSDEVQSDPNGAAAAAASSAAPVQSSPGQGVWGETAQGGEEKGGEGATEVQTGGEGVAAKTAEQVAAEQQAAAAGKPLTEEALAAAVQKIVDSNSTSKSGKEAASEPQITTEQFEKAFHVFKPTPELLTQMGIEPTEAAMKGFAAMSHAIVKQAVVMSTYLVEQAKKELGGQITPLRNAHESQANEQLVNRFFAAHPDLKGKDPLLLAIKAQMIQENFRGDEKTAFAELAKRAKTILGGQAQGAAPAGTAQGNGKPASGAPRMSAVSTAGQGGAGGAGAKPAAKSAGQRVWSD